MRLSGRSTRTSFGAKARQFILRDGRRFVPIAVIGLLFTLITACLAVPLPQKVAAQEGAFGTPTPSNPSPTPTFTPSPPPTDTPTPTATGVPLPTSTLTPLPSLTPPVTPTATAAPFNPTNTPAAPSATPSIPSTTTPTLPIVFPTELPRLTATPLPSLVVPTPDPRAGYAPGSVIVQFAGLPTDALAAVTSIAQEYGATVRGRFAPLDMWLLAVQPGRVPGTLAVLRQDARVVVAEPNYLVRAYEIPDDPYWTQQSYLSLIQVPSIWDVVPSASPLVVAVLDTGVDVSHPDLAPVIWSNPGEMGTDAAGRDRRTNGVDDDGNGYSDDWQGWNALSGTGDVRDSHGHGTHVAGVAAAAVNNGVGIAGVAPGARIMPVQVLGSDGAGTYADVAAGILYAVENGARIVNLSLGGTGDSALLGAAVGYAESRGAVVVAAASHPSQPGASYPAAYPSVIGVGAAGGQDEALSRPAACISWADLAAPGSNIYTTHPDGGYTYASGDSMAAAQVSGIAALMFGRAGLETPATVRDALVATALSPTGGFNRCRPGLVQALDALNYAAGGALPVASLTPTPSPSPPPDDVGPSPAPLPSPPVAVGTPAPALSPGAALPAGVTLDEMLWGIAQRCTGGSIADSRNSVDQAFDDRVAFCRLSETGDMWTYTVVQNTDLSVLAWVTLDVRFYAAGSRYGRVDLEIGDGETWHLVASFDDVHPMPRRLMTLSYDISAIFTAPAEVNRAQIRFLVRERGEIPVAIQLDGARIDAYAYAMPSPTPLPPLPTPTLSPPGPTAVPGAGNPHGDYNAAADTCTVCHRSHGSVTSTPWSDEDICLTCHGERATTAGIPWVEARAVGIQRFFAHDVSTTRDVHRPDERYGRDFGGDQRHVECQDCHEPHEAARGPVAAPALQREMGSASGVVPVWTKHGAPVAYIWMPQAEREHQVCFKCHSSYTALPGYTPYGWDGGTYVPDGLQKLTYSGRYQVPDSRDMALEFNPFNASFHPVVARGRNRDIPAGSFVGGWSVDSVVYCVDCHRGTAGGAHRSSLIHLLGGGDEYPTANPDRVAMTGDELCFDCHDVADYLGSGRDTYFRLGRTNLHESHAGEASCYLCHDTHGSEQLHLLNLDTSIEGASTYLLPGYDGRMTDSQSFWQIGPDRTVKTCFIVCHGHDHTSTPYPNFTD